MGRKKADVIPPCPHCGIVFQMQLKWCSHCDDHMLPGEFSLGHDICDRCARGDNDEYVAKKKGRADRIAMAVELQADQKNWCTCGAVEAYNEWVISPEYEKRFERDQERRNHP